MLKFHYKQCQLTLTYISIKLISSSWRPSQLRAKIRTDGPVIEVEANCRCKTMSDFYEEIEDMHCGRGFLNSLNQDLPFNPPDNQNEFTSCYREAIDDLDAVRREICGFEGDLQQLASLTVPELIDSIRTNCPRGQAKRLLVAEKHRLQGIVLLNSNGSLAALGMREGVPTG